MPGSDGGSLASAARDPVRASATPKRAQTPSKQTPAEATRSSKNRPSRSADKPKRREFKPSKDIRHLDSRSGVRAALKAERSDTRFDAAPRFIQPPTSCYNERPKPHPGTSNDPSDTVLANLLYNRPVSSVEVDRVKQNRLTLRKHVGPRGGQEFFVSSFQQKLSEDQPGDIQVSRRVLMSSTTRNEPSCSSKQVPWFQQAVSKVDTADLAEAAAALAARRKGKPLNGDSSKIPVATSVKETPERAAGRGSGASRPAWPPAEDSDKSAEVPTTLFSARESKEASAKLRLTSTEKAANGVSGPGGGHVRAAGLGGRAGWGGRPPPNSGRPPPSASSALSAENLMVHERSTCGTSRSSQRSDSEASSSRISRSKRRAGSASGTRSESASERSVASAPPRKIDWNRVNALSEQEGAPYRQREHSFQRAHSEDVLAQRGHSEFGSASARRLRAPGTCGPFGEAKAKRDSSSDIDASSDHLKDILSGRSGGSQESYRRRHAAGTMAPSPSSKKPWADHPVAELQASVTKESSQPYRRQRSVRGVTPPPEKLSMPLGAQPVGYDKVFPAPWNPLGCTKSSSFTLDR